MATRVAIHPMEQPRHKILSTKLTLRLIANPRCQPAGRARQELNEKRTASLSYHAHGGPNAFRRCLAFARGWRGGPFVRVRGFAAHGAGVRIDDATPKCIMQPLAGNRAGRVVHLQAAADSAIEQATHKPDFTRDLPAETKKFAQLDEDRECRCTPSTYGTTLSHPGR